MVPLGARIARPGPIRVLRLIDFPVNRPDGATVVKGDTSAPQRDAHRSFVE